MVFNEEENELREFDHSNNTLDQGNLLRGIDNKTVRRQERKFCTTSKTDRHLSRLKIRQRISVMKTNNLYSSRFSRELAFSFTFCLEVNKNAKITENL